MTFLLLLASLALLAPLSFCSWYLHVLYNEDILGHRTMVKASIYRLADIGLAKNYRLSSSVICTRKAVLRYTRGKGTNNRQRLHTLDLENTAQGCVYGLRPEMRDLRGKDCKTWDTWIPSLEAESKEINGVWEACGS
jgi:hypothetical protein